MRFFNFAIIFVLIFDLVYLQEKKLKLISLGGIRDLFHKHFSGSIMNSEKSTVKDIVEIIKRNTFFSAKNVYTKTRQTLDCIACLGVVGSAMKLARTGLVRENLLVKGLAKICAHAGYASHKVCVDVIQSYMPTLMYIVKHNPRATAKTWCHLALQSQSSPGICLHPDPRFDWTVDIPDPPHTISDTPVVSTQDPFDVAIFSDVHLDPLYAPNGVSGCGDPICCRKKAQRKQSTQQRKTKQFMPSQKSKTRKNDDSKTEYIIKKAIVYENGELHLDLSVAPKVKNVNKLIKFISLAPIQDEKAGQWGDYGDCDTPPWTFENLIDTIKETHKNIDAIYYIGDAVYIGFNDITRKIVGELNGQIVDTIKKKFGDIMVVPVIGNHDTTPMNMFAPSHVTDPHVNTAWVYKAFAEKWDSYIPDEAKDIFFDIGCYTVLLRPGLRAIVLNNNIAFKYNWWLNYDPLEPKRYLEWLVKELFKAEQTGEKVHILTHLPPGDEDLLHIWGKEYHKIIKRFSSTIIAEFNGHTHNDQFKIFYDEKENPINVAWNVGSVVTYSYRNPNYKIVNFDPKTFEPMNILTYIFNITEANLTPNKPPRWFQLYDMLTGFKDIKNLSPTSMNELVREIASDAALINKYSTYYTKQADLEYPDCDKKCKLQRVCDTMVTVLWDNSICLKVLPTLQMSHIKPTKLKQTDSNNCPLA